MDGDATLLNALRSALKWGEKIKSYSEACEMKWDEGERARQMRRQP